MIDTFRKGGATTFDMLSLDYLKSFVGRARERGLLAAIAGGLKVHHLHLCIKLGFDVVGIRGAACKGGRGGRIDKRQVELLKQTIESLLASQ